MVQGVLGGSWAVIIRVTFVITHIRGFIIITLLITTHAPPSRV